MKKGEVFIWFMKENSIRSLTGLTIQCSKTLNQKDVYMYIYSQKIDKKPGSPEKTWNRIKNSDLGGET